MSGSPENSRLKLAQVPIRAETQTKQSQPLEVRLPYLSVRRAIGSLTVSL